MLDFQMPVLQETEQSTVLVRAELKILAMKELRKVAIISPEEVPLPDQLQETSQDESLSSFRGCDFVSSDCVLSSVDCLFSDCDDQCSSVPLSSAF